jgi:hypothetical protein
MRFIDFANYGRSNVFSYFLSLVCIITGFFTAQLLAVSFLPLFYSEEEYTSLLTQADYLNLLGKNGFFAFALVPFVFLFLLILYSIRFIHKRKIITVFTARKRFDWKRFFFSFSVMVVILTALLLIQLFFDQSLVWNFNIEKFIVLAILVIFLIPIQIMAEELLFRSYVLQGLKKRLGHSGHSVVISGIMFGMLHLGNPEIAEIGFHLVFYYILAGIFLGAIVLFDNGIELTLGYHAANNMFAALMITSDWQAFQTHSVFRDVSDPGNGIGSIVFSIILYAVLFFLFYKKFNWQGLKEIWIQ